MIARLIKGYPIKSSPSHVPHSVQRDEALLRRNVMIADGAQLAVGTHQKLDIVNGVREADVLKGEHVGDGPKVLEGFRVAGRTLGLWHRQIKLGMGAVCFNVAGIYVVSQGYSLVARCNLQLGALARHFRSACTAPPACSCRFPLNRPFFRNFVYKWRSDVMRQTAVSIQSNFFQGLLIF